jgi:hypothetical protein
MRRLRAILAALTLFAGVMLGFGQSSQHVWQPAIGTPASAQFSGGGGGPPPGGGGGSPGASDSTGHGGNRGKFSAKSFLLGQGISVGCAAVSEIVDGGIIMPAREHRELTPIEANDNAAACGLLPAVIVKLIDMAMGIKDNACSFDVARRALKFNNSAWARQELLWRDGSWDRDQAKFLAEYYDCYHQQPQSHVHHKKIHFRRHKLVS